MLSNLLPKVNRLLQILAACAALFCGAMVFRMVAQPDIGTLKNDIQTQQAAADQLETQILQLENDISLADADSYAVLTAAEEEYAAVQAEYDACVAERDDLQAQADAFENGEEEIFQLQQDIAELRTEYGQTVRKLEDMILSGESDYRICYLTFDDGPSAMTGDFLDVIDELDIYVTFFTIGRQLPEDQSELQASLLRREALGGHTIANHTYTHSLHTALYYSLDNFLQSVDMQDQLVYEATGLHTDIVRFPAGSYYCPFRTKAIDALEEQGYGWIDWSANACDSGENVNSSRFVVNIVLEQVRNEEISVVLMHDWRSETLEALPTIVETLRSENYVFLPLFVESSTIGSVYPQRG